MAGSPKKRARRAAAAAAAAEYGQPIGPNAPAHDARARAGGPARPDAHGYRPQPGPETRAVSDRTTAQTVADLAHALNSCVSVRIDRLRPVWCNGWIEDYPLDAEGLGELLEYLRDEHGGSSYKITALTENGIPIFTGKLPISGPPKENGVFINRDEWDGRMHGGRKSNGNGQPAKQNGSSLGGMVDLLGLVLNESRESRNATLNAVKETTAITTEHQKDLMGIIVESREKETQRQSFGSQLREVTDNMKAVEKVRQTLTPGEDNAGVMDLAVKEAAGGFIQKVLSAEKATAAIPPNRPRQTAPPIPESRTVKARVVRPVARKK